MVWNEKESTFWVFVWVTVTFGFFLSSFVPVGGDLRSTRDKADR